MKSVHNKIIRQLVKCKRFDYNKKLVNCVFVHLLLVFHLVDGTVCAETNQTFIEKLFNQAVTTTEPPELDKFDFGPENVETNQTFIEKLFNQAITTTEPPDLYKFDFDPETVKINQSVDTIEKLFNQAITTTELPELDNFDFYPQKEMLLFYSPTTIIKQYKNDNSTKLEQQPQHTSSLDKDEGDRFKFKSSVRLTRLYNKDRDSSSSKQLHNTSSLDNDQDFSKTPGITLKQNNQTTSTSTETPEQRFDHQNFGKLITDDDYDISPTSPSGASSTLPLLPLLFISYIIYFLV